MEKKFIIHQLITFSLFSFGCIAAKSKGDNDKLIFDISLIIREAVQAGGNGQLPSKTLQAITSQNKGSNRIFLMYYETDVQLNVPPNLLKLVNLLEKMKTNTPNFTPKILLTIKDSQWRGIPDNANEYISKHYSNVISLVNKHFAFFAGVSVEITRVENLCKVSYGKCTVTRSILSEIKRLVENNEFKAFKSKTVAIKIGYVVDHTYLDHNFHTESIKEADYLVVNIPLQLNDKLFVESYGIFKENIEQIIARVTGQISKFDSESANKTVYFRISLKTALDRSKVKVYIVNENDAKKYIHEEEFRINNALGKSDQATAIRYQQLLSKYVEEWTNTKADDAIVIFNYLTDNVKDLTWMTSNSGPIPYLTNLPVIGSRNRTAFGVRLSASSGILLDDIASSGFDTVMINGKTWKEFAQHVEHFALCNERACKPMKVIYMVDEINPFRPPFQTDIRRLNEIGEKSLKSLVFSHSYGENSIDTWNKILADFKKVTKNTESTLHSACYVWSGSFRSLAENGNCDNICIANKIKYVEGCGSVTNSTDAFIWSGTFSFVNLLVPKFFHDIMNRLDAFVIARQIVWSQYPNKTIILQVKGEYIGFIGNQITHSLYCDSYGERLGQFYEAILTWARIHDFPVILETGPVMTQDSAHYGNPLWLEELKSTYSNRVKQIMESGPLFVRRSYNRSKVFGTWAQGALPCIRKAADIALVNLNFQHEFSGVTLNLNIRSENISLLPEEIETLLLFAHGKFAKVEVILQHSQLEILYKTISNPNFQINLKQNGIQKRKIFLQVQDRNTESEKSLNKISSVLRNVGFSFHMMTYVESDSPQNELGGTFETEIVHSNCTNLAYKIVFRRLLEEKMKKVSYLICETDPFSADNDNETRMQEYLDFHFYLKKLLGYFYPNLKEIHFRLQPIFARNFRDKTESLMLFLSDVNTYAQSYKIHYFLLPAFVDALENETVPSFWTITNYTNLSDSSVYQDNYATFTNQSTWRPTRLSSSNNGQTQRQQAFDMPDEIIYAIVGVLLAVIILLGIILIRICIKRFYLSAKDIKEFRNGRQDTLKEAIIERRKNKVGTGNIFDGLVFQNGCELSKKDVEFDTRDILFEGKFSNVYQGKHTETQKDVVVKMPNKNCSKRRFKAMLSEVKLLCYLGEHSNIVNFMGCHSNEIGKGVLWIVMEFCEGGTLLEHLKMRKETKTDQWNINELVKFSLEISCGMEYVDGENVIHGNLCTKNVLLDQHGTCKINGFKLSEKLQEYQVYMRKNRWEKLPWQWMAPESLKSLEFSLKSDVWSFGVTLWEIFSLGSIPYPGESLTPLFVDGLEKGTRMSCPPYATKQTYDVMLDCWKKEPRERREFFQLVKYFTNLRTKSFYSDINPSQSLTSSNL